jgi:serine protease DegQ
MFSGIVRLTLSCAVLGVVAPLAPAGDRPAPAKAAAPPVLVPYRLTKTQHVLVRAKINGKGPFNFILDTGAPALFVAKKTAEAAGVKPDDRGWTTFDRFEVEGGVVVERAKGRADDLFQLEGMNGLGLAGVELHGVIGYNVLARYRIE